MPKLIRGVITAGVLALAIWIIFLAAEKVLPGSISVIKYILVVLLPFLLAVVISVMIEPVVSFFERRVKFSRGISVAFTMLLVLGGIGTLLTLVIIQLVTELVSLSFTIDIYIKNLREFIDGLIATGTNVYVNLPPSVVDSIKETVASLAGSLRDFALGLINTLLYLVSSVPGMVMVIIVSLLATFFISRDRDIILRIWMRLLPAPWGDRSIGVSQEVSKAFMAYIRAQMILVSISMFQSIVGLYLIGAEYALTIGLLIGFFDLIPILGPSTVFIPWLAWCFFIGEYSFGIKLSILFAMVLVVRQLLEAKIVSANLGLHPLATLIAIYVGLKVLGVPGLILGPISLIAIQAGIKASQVVRQNIQ